MREISHISEFLTRVEGQRQTQGYIPCNLKTGGTANYKGGANPQNYSAMGASGVTIATGCDLGQTDISTLQKYGLSDDFLLNRLKPYIGLKKEDAIYKLHSLPLTITEAQAEAIDHAVHNGYLSRFVIPAYNKASKVPFLELPQNAQDVIMSVCFQKGCGGVRREWPKLWNYLITQNWKAASNELCTGFVQYKHRRNIEGKHLAELL